MSLFKTPEPNRYLTAMIRGDAGAGKTWLGLSFKRVIGGRRVAYIGNDRGAKFYAEHPEVGGFLAIETVDVDQVDAAIAELESDGGKTFGAVVVDTISGLWDSEQKRFEKADKNGQKRIPMHAWRPLRQQHENRLRRLQALQMHAILICEEKPVYERDGDDIKEVGTREDADKKDSYVSDLRLRLFLQDKKFFAEVLKDRTQTFKMGQIIESPRPEMWIKTAVEPKPDSLEPKLVASALIESAKKIATDSDASQWKEANELAVKRLPPDFRKEVLKVLGEVAAKLGKKTSGEAA